MKSESGPEGFANMDPGNLDGLQDIISEVYANNHHELAPCLDGLGAEAMQSSNASHTTTEAFNHMNFHGSNLGKILFTNNNALIIISHEIYSPLLNPSRFLERIFLSLVFLHSSYSLCHSLSLSVSSIILFSQASMVCKTC